MDNLEQHIKNNRPAFDEEPAAGHYERLLQKQKTTQRRKIISLWAPAGIAASLAILLSIHLLAPQQNSGAGSGKVVVVCEQTDDMKGCYLSKMNDIAFHIGELTKDFDKWDKQLVHDEVENIIESAKEVETIVPKELSVEESNQILAGCYKQSIESLQTIVEIINENK